MKDQASLKIIPLESDSGENAFIEVANFDVWYNDAHVLHGVDLSFPEKEITCIIGPSGSGKSTLIRSINRINDGVEGYSIEGSISINGQNIFDRSTDVVELRSKVGMVFQKPCVFPKSISENVLFGVRNQKKLSRHEALSIVEDNLKSVSLWDEVSHRLNDKASSLSIGQQQRLCMARTLAMQPEVILLDEPTSSLDPVSTRAIEEMMLSLKDKYTLIFVTHNIQQAKRIADNVVFISRGKVVESGLAEDVLNKPSATETEEYIRGEVGKI